MAEFVHESVLLEETVEYLNINPSGVYVDATLGGGGHASKIAAKMDSQGLLVGIDQDQTAIKTARERLDGVKPRFEAVKQNFVHLKTIVENLGIAKIDGIVFDLGVSSPQFDIGERGFSYHQDAPLDMRMDQTNPFSAAHLVNSAPIEELTRIFREYGEERWGKRIALFIEKYRRDTPIETTGQLVQIIKDAIPAAARRSGPHPARRTFQALRIAVNHELEYLEEALGQALELLKPGGRIAVISFHSLEDRIVKETYLEWAKGCECPKSLPVCICGKTPRIRMLTRKPVTPTTEELTRNPRARSSKLRVAEKLESPTAAD